MRFVDHTGAPAHQLHVDERLGDAPLERDRTRRRGPAAAANSPSTPAEPQPHALPSRDAEQQRRQRDRQQRGRRPSRSSPARAPATRARSATSPTRRAPRRPATEPEDPLRRRGGRRSRRRARGRRRRRCRRSRRSVPIAVATRSRGNSSRMIPKASGKIAPPAPWIARPAISTPIEPPSADTSEPSAEHAERDRAAIAPCRTCRRGGRAAASRRSTVSRKAVSSHVAASARSPPNVALDRRQRRDDHRLRERVGDGAQDEDAAACGSGVARASLAASAAVTVQVVDRGGERCSSRAACARSPGSSRRWKSSSWRSRDARRAWRPRARAPSAVSATATTRRSRVHGACARRAASRSRPSSIRVAVGGADAGGARRARRRRSGPSRVEQRLEQVELRQRQLAVGRPRRPARGPKRGGSRRGRRRRPRRRCAGRSYGTAFR